MVKVKVQQKDGEITISHHKPEPQVYKVSDGTVSVSEADLEHFLGVVRGSSADKATGDVNAPPPAGNPGAETKQ